MVCPLLFLWRLNSPESTVVVQERLVHELIGLGVDPWYPWD